MTTYGITGASGRIGRELLKYPKCFSLDGDIQNVSQIEMEVTRKKPDVIVHLASVSNVDYCEQSENQYRVNDINIVGSMNVLDVADSKGIPVVFLSTDHVFSGRRWWGGYREWEFPRPVNYYGFTKFAVESFRQLYPTMKIVRTSYLFDKERLAPKIKILTNKNWQEYPTFIKRSFMHTSHFVESFYDYLTLLDDMPTVLHISGSKVISWYEFMVSLAKEMGINEQQVIPRTREVDDANPRPYNAGLNVSKSKRLGLSQFSYLDGIKLCH